MKKIFAFLLIIIICFFITACGNKSTENPTQEPINSDTQSSDENMDAFVREESNIVEPEFTLPTNLSVGDYINLGHYEQDNNLSNGAEEIEWLVLYKKEKDNGNDVVVLLSHYALDSKPFNIENTRMNWEYCTIRSWLNNEFFNTAFTPEEQEIISTYEVEPHKNYNCAGYCKGYDQGNATEDKVFLLSTLEAEQFFVSNDMSCEPTRYAVAQGLHLAGAQYTCEWLLRTGGENSYYICTVDHNGKINYHGPSNNVEGMGVRPAIVISTNNN